MSVSDYDIQAALAKSNAGGQPSGTTANHKRVARSAAACGRDHLRIKQIHSIESPFLRGFLD
jgi:hypothetical protein